MQIFSRIPLLPHIIPLLGLGALSVLGPATVHPAAQGYSFHEITSADLGAPATPINRALAVSNDGVVIGTVGVDPNGGTSPTDGYEYDTASGAVSLLNYRPKQGGTTFAAIRSDGSTVLGFYGSEGTTSSPWFTDKGGSITALPDPYALLGVDPSTGYVNYNSINSSGTIASAYSTDGNTEKIFLLDADGTLTTSLDPNDNDGYTIAESINASGTVASFYVNYNADVAYPIYQYIAYGFLRSADGTYTDVGGVFDTSVDVPGAAATYLTSINDSGQISWLFFDADGNQHSFYADPALEPSQCAAPGIGGGILALVARRREVNAAQD